MASHQIAIAKASLAAGLLRPDPTSVPRDEITALHNLLDKALSHCSPGNIQNCKQWLLQYVTSSSNRVNLWAKYLIALAGSFTTGEDEAPPAPKLGAARPGPSAKRKRLHILYLLNDLFHHTKYHQNTTAVFSTFSGSLQSHIVEILSYAASYDQQKHPKHHKRLDELLDIWQEHEYFGGDYVNKLREVVVNAAVAGPVGMSAVGDESIMDSSRKIPGRDAPFVMPATHGDTSTPYYDLPAGNLVPHIIPNSTISIRPDSIKPLQFLAGPADEKLVTVLKGFLKDVDQIYGNEKPEEKDDEVVDIDDLGQTVLRDSITGDILDGETYYGWSRAFCQQMKKRNAKSNSRSPRRSHSRSRSPRKRRRYSDSSESDDSRWRSSRSRSRSQPHRRRDGSARRYDDSRSRSRSASWRRSGSRERSYSPQPPAPRSIPPDATHHPPPPPPPPPPLPPLPQQHPQPAYHYHQHNNPYGNIPPQGYPPPPPHMQFQPPPGPGGGGQQHAFPPGMPAPPPPPPNYQGPWPPPPPPMSNFGPPGVGNPPNFPPPYGGSNQYPPQPMPPGSYHFPPPHQPHQAHQPNQGGHGSWQQQHQQQQQYPPPSGRGWR